MTDITHPDREVRQLAKLMQDDDDIETMATLHLRRFDCRNLTELFESNPEEFFELHEACMMLVEQLPPEEPMDMAALARLVDGV